MIRILQCVNAMNRAGLETMLMNYYRNIDRTQIQFDFLTHRPDRGDYDDEIERLGGKIYYAPRLYPQNYPAYFSYMKEFFREHPEYRIMHSHIDSMSYLPLLAGKKAGIPVRIAHSHNTSLDKDFKYLLKQYFRFRVRGVVTHRFACGQEAGRFLFGRKDFLVIPNAVDARRFSYDAGVRAAKRQALELDGKFVVGHVGRLSYQKNHKFLIPIFAQVAKQEPNALLLLIGVGEKEAEIREQVCQLGLENAVRFLGSRSDVNELYQAMDVFVMPSLFEGIPVVGIEAQFAGLPCIFSDKVPQEVMFTDNCQSLSLQASAGEWAQQLLATRDRQRGTEQIINAGYDIKNAHSLLEQQYLALDTQ